MPGGHGTRRPTDLSLARYRAIPAGGSRKDLPDELLTPCWRKHTSGAGDVMGRLIGTSLVTIRTEFFKPEKGRYCIPPSIGRSPMPRRPSSKAQRRLPVVRHQDLDRTTDRQRRPAAVGASDRRPRSTPSSMTKC